MSWNSTSIDSATRARGVRAAQGHAQFDVLLLNATLVDVATSELREADVGIVGSLIASVHPRGSRSDAVESHDLEGRWIIPGLIDTHVHFESSHMSPDQFASIVVPQGTTTVFFDPHELANVLGIEGVRYAIEASRNLPLRFICAAPSCVPSSPGLEMSGAEFDGTQMHEMLQWPEVAGIGEMMDMPGVLHASARVDSILAEGLKSGKLIEGHARGLAGPALQAYVTAGVSSDHEIISAQDALEKLRAGLILAIRGSHDYLLPEIVKAINKLPQIPSTLTFCTDDVPPDVLVSKGGMCDVLRRLVQYGLDPVQAIRCATLNAATRLRRSDLGLIGPGRVADIAVLSDLKGIAVERVFASGKLAAKERNLVSPLQPSNHSLPTNTVKTEPLTINDCRIPVLGTQSGRASIRAIRGARFTEWSEVEVEVRDGFAVVPQDYSVLLIKHRHGRHTLPPQRTLLEDWGEVRGAIATTYSHDSHNLVVLGRIAEDMQAAANAVIASNGGMAVSKDGRVIAKVDLPIAGILSNADPRSLAEAFSRLRQAADEIFEWEPPYRVFKAIEGISLACNPCPHLTDLGLTDGSSGQIVDQLLTKL